MTILASARYNVSENDDRATRIIRDAGCMAIVAHDLTGDGARLSILVKVLLRILRI